MPNPYDTLGDGTTLVGANYFTLADPIPNRQQHQIIQIGKQAHGVADAEKKTMEAADAELDTDVPAVQLAICVGILLHYTPEPQGEKQQPTKVELPAEEKKYAIVVTKLAAANASSASKKTSRTNFFALVNKGADDPGICQLAPLSTRQVSALVAFFPEWTGPVEDWISFCKKARENRWRKNIRTYIDEELARAPAEDSGGAGNIEGGILARIAHDLRSYRTSGDSTFLDRIVAELTAAGTEAGEEVEVQPLGYPNLTSTRFSSEGDASPQPPSRPFAPKASDHLHQFIQVQKQILHDILTAGESAKESALEERSLNLTTPSQVKDLGTAMRALALTPDMAEREDWVAQMANHVGRGTMKPFDEVIRLLKADIEMLESSSEALGGSSSVLVDDPSPSHDHGGGDEGQEEHSGQGEEHGGESVDEDDEHESMEGEIIEVDDDDFK
ncbi:hypothetical protein B0T16DRAFT_501190 [Cercophora newfieldiana]|uniref:Uncharacterized protein n=1 Tax=Cercophora newfieldiana TaxID=92897 RepID=A0AA39YQ46_9PEZI|nr:hypothetical protein B0T16DRAFT_501190 [Cercophora newfieldiana]